MAFLQHFASTAPQANDPAAQIQKTADAIKEKTTADLEEYKKKVLPDGPVFRVEDISPGTGQAAICGQHVSITYTAAQGDNQPIDDSAAKEKPLQFSIGDHTAMPALEQGVIGMKPGGKRTVIAPAAMAYANGFARADVAENARITFNVELLEATPPLPDTANIPYRIATTSFGSGTGAQCGTPVKLLLTVWDANGKKLFPEGDKTPEPVTITPGASDIILGIEQGIIGIKPGEKRTLVIPPVLQDTLNGGLPKIDMDLPEHQTILVDVEAVP